MFLFLTVVQALIAAALVGVILVQKSEGGGLGMGGSPSGLMSARGAANFLTRATAILAGHLALLHLVPAALAVNQTTGRDIDTSLQRTTVPTAPAPEPVDPLAGQANPAPAPAGQAPAGDPLSGAAGR